VSRSKSNKVVPNAGAVPSGTAADTGIDEQNADTALRKPKTDTSPGSPDYALSGPLAAKVPPMRKPQGEQTGAVPPKSYGGSS
jgi:hypothetical protein